MCEYLPTPPAIGINELAERLICLQQLSPTEAWAAAHWLLVPQGSWPATLAPYRAVCPDPAALLLLVCFFTPNQTPQNNALLTHLTTGWRTGETPAPWFDPLGYEVLSATRRNPPDAAILHYVQEGWAQGLDPDPRRVCDLSNIPTHSLILNVSRPEETAAVLALLDRHLFAPPESKPKSGGEWIVLDASPAHTTARALTTTSRMAQYRTNQHQMGELRIIAVHESTSSAELAALAKEEASEVRLLQLPLFRVADLPRPPQLSPPRPATPALHLTNRRTRLRQGEIAPRLHILCPAPNMMRAHRWGDFHFAESLATALQSAGCETHIILADSWKSSQEPAPDATLLLRGVRRCRPRPGPVNLMWMLSHPDRVEQDELARYDHVFVGSLPYAEHLRTFLGNRASPLLQCSDPDRFAPNAAILPDPESQISIPAHPLLFVGNSRQVDRWVVSAAIAAGFPLALYGAEWEKTSAAPYVLAENLPNVQLGSYYRRAGIVLNDHWPDMAANGFVSNRLFDVAMAGGFVISDSFEGAGMFFGNLVQVQTAAELEHALHHFTAHPAERALRADALHTLVRQNHTFSNRAAQILARLRLLF